jgi:hypothetical protein
MEAPDIDAPNIKYHYVIDILNPLGPGIKV